MAPLTLLGWVSLACFALMAGLRYVNNQDVEVVRLDLLSWSLWQSRFRGFVLIGRRVTRLRRADRRKDVFLASLATNCAIHWRRSGTRQPSFG